MARQSSPRSELSKLQERMGYAFSNPQLLERALTHSSLAFEQSTVLSDSFDNEQVEFLGDAVVGLIAADSLYRRYPELKEGDLTRLRAGLVSRQHLGQVAVALELGEALLLGKGEERSGGRKKAALLANCLEAVIGAIYLDGGLKSAGVFVEKWVVEPDVTELRGALERGGGIGDHKSALQEYLQARKAGQPQYFVKGESGPDHRKRFLVEVRTREADSSARVLARGSGTTKRNAEQEAARRAYQKLVRESQQAKPVLPAVEMKSVEGEWAGGEMIS
jgi:ribonuclease III